MGEQACPHPAESVKLVGRPGDLWYSCSACHQPVPDRRPAYSDLQDEIERLKAALLDIASGCDTCNSEDAQRFSAIARKALQ